MTGMTGEVRVPISKVTGQMTINVRVTGMRAWRVRMWLAIQLIRLAGFVGGVNVKVNA